MVLMHQQKEKALAENLENKQLTHREMTKEGGYIEQLTKKQLIYFFNLPAESLKNLKKSLQIVGKWK